MKNQAGKKFTRKKNKILLILSQRTEVKVRFKPKSQKKDKNWLHKLKVSMQKTITN